MHAPRQTRRSVSYWPIFGASESSRGRYKDQGQVLIFFPTFKPSFLLPLHFLLLSLHPLSRRFSHRRCTTQESFRQSSTFDQVFLPTPFRHSDHLSQQGSWWYTSPFQIRVPCSPSSNNSIPTPPSTHSSPSLGTCSRSPFF